MQRLGASYDDPYLNVPLPASPANSFKVERTQFRKVSRSCSIYKPSFKLAPAAPAARHDPSRFEVSAGKRQKYRREVAVSGYGGAENANDPAADDVGPDGEE